MAPGPTIVTASDGPTLSCADASGVAASLSRTDAPTMTATDNSGGVQRLAPDAVLTQTNLTGALSDIQDDPDTPDANWMTEAGALVLRVSFPTPAGGKLVGTQEIRVRVRPS